MNKERVGRERARELFDKMRKVTLGFDWNKPVTFEPEIVSQSPEIAGQSPSKKNSKCCKQCWLEKSRPKEEL